MDKKEALAAEHKKFRDQYRATTSADWQTFQLGLEAGWNVAMSTLPSGEQQQGEVKEFTEQQVRKAIAHFDLSMVHPASILHDQTIRERADAAIEHIRSDKTNK